LIPSGITEFPGNQLLVEVGISAAGMHEKGAERNSFRVHHAAFLVSLTPYLLGLPPSPSILFLIL
jgi:hypothetical protein